MHNLRLAGTPARKRVVIVGAGPGGLASAMLLASAGLDVTVIERQEQVGGRTTTLEENGFRFDLGPTFFLYPEVLRRIFAACGRDLEDEVELVRLDPQYRLVFEGGGQLRATPELDRMEAEISALAPADAGGLRSFIHENRSKLEAFKPILESPFNGLGDTLRLPLLKLLPLLRPGQSVDRDLKRYFSDPRVRLAFSFQSKYLGMSPFRCPSLFTILSFLEYEYGVFHPIGGCGELTRAMARVAEELGVEIRVDEPVEEILFDGRRAVGVRTPAGRYGADALVVNADFAHAMSTLVPDRLRRRWTDRRLARKKYSCSTYMMYLGIKGEVDLDHHTIWLASDYEINLSDIETGHRLSENPSFYVQNPGVTDPTLAPEGHSSLYVLFPVSHQHPNIDWTVERDRFRATAYRQLSRLGLRDLEERVVSERILTPAAWQTEHAIYRGATFNLTHSLDQMLHLRPRNRFEDLDSVYLVGGGTHPGSGLPVIFESARISSRLLTEDLGIETDWDVERPAASTAVGAANLPTAVGLGA